MLNLMVIQQYVRIEKANRILVIVSIRIKKGQEVVYRILNLGIMQEEKEANKKNEKGQEEVDRMLKLGVMQEKEANKKGQKEIDRVLNLRITQRKEVDQILMTLNLMIT